MRGLRRDQGRGKEKTKGGESLHDRRGTVSLWPGEAASNKGHVAGVYIRIAQNLPNLGLPLVSKYQDCVSFRRAI